ncbi:hypothetical protein LSTR_LSTR008054 [Laodelphax striatellus]|uniref:Delta-like protein n=1 Tax=Laodelphax striatellus TaxID=195883 RepID=A0A482XLY4_LAOST|nr:hypothetical protein LSTR_LSTR008054 [Laodelphax striatellus]
MALTQQQRVVAVICLLFAVFTNQAAECSGNFELQILEMVNYRGETMNGGCCGQGVGGGSRGGLAAKGLCTGRCSTVFRVCLKEYQSNVTSTGSCSFGNTSSPVLGGNSFTITDPDNGKLVLPFSFRWTRSFTLILQALDFVNTSTSESNVLIEEASYSGIILPSSEWHTLNHEGQVARITYRVRVQCAANYYNATCQTFCRPRDDNFGHYKCSTNGDKECIHGWKGDNCQTPICRAGCHPEHGHCSQPGECECRRGWRGKLCDECEPYPGCKHGYCKEIPWQCICETNWGGILCDQDLNYCGTNEPCQNGGTCENTAPDSFLCNCPEGFSGLNCEIVDNPCVTGPCANGGACLETAGQFHCVCAAGWTGSTCRINIDECQSSPCQNGGTCIDLVNGYSCSCTSAWEGPNCQFDANECLNSPCINADSCQNVVGDYICKCQKGWTGKNCDININDCHGQCQHGATCIDLVNDYHCACQPGYTGRDCHTDINDCESGPCLNGGECVDQVNGFRCICPVGFVGTLCEVDHDHCNPNPCENEAPCFNTQADYYCHCPKDWQGKNCSVPRIHCNNPPCDWVETTCSFPTSSNMSQQIFATGACGEHGRCYATVLGSYQCVCDPGYTGKYCHENINDCKLNPCQNGGTCVDKVNSFQCICREGWEGDTCTINKNECEPNPCQNNGTCIDGDADFSCECRGGWKGKTCSLRHSHCDHGTCQNGGSCQDLGHSYLCRCPFEWEGTTCHIAKTQACRLRPCQNGATCINTGDTYTCICKEGFEGPNCQNDINDCSPLPCFNGGKCVDGVNWFRCECAVGFAGPDCRININECASNPCGSGATCIDGIASYSCICPPGLKGVQCQQVDEVSIRQGVCLWQGQYFASGSKWSFDCNTCSCYEGEVRCTKIWCGLGNCLGQVTATAICQDNQVCVPMGREWCITGGCVPWGECRTILSGKLVGPPQLPAPSTCWPNQIVLSNACARLTLFLDRNKLLLRTGISVESFCADMRLMLAAHHAANHIQNHIVLLCDLKTGANDTIEVAISDSKNDEDAVKEAVRVIGEQISRKQVGITSSAALMAVVEVKVETALVSQQRQGGSYMQGSFTEMAVILILCGIAATFYWLRLQRSPDNLGLTGVDPCHRHHDDEKSNNLQNEENLRRYANPLKEDSASMTGSASCVAGSQPLASSASLGDLTPRISVVRPLSSASSAEMLEMICEGGPTSSQVLLLKTQNADMKKNTVCEASSSSKDFSSCKRINVKVLPPVQRTLPPVNDNSDVLTVLV